MQKITPNLWFNNNAAEAVAFYTSVFQRARTHETSYYSEAGREIHGMEPGAVLTIDFELEGLRFTAINAGPQFTFTPAVSFIVNCPDAAGVDALWEKLSPGGTALMPLDKYPFSERFGWLQDKYGLSWQLVLAEHMPKRRIVPSLMFTGEVCGRAEEAMDLYAGLFEDSSVGEVYRYGPGQEPDQAGTVMYADFTLAGQKFATMDSGHKHDFTFTEAVSLLVTCEDQAEINHYWEGLAAEPDGGQCGWLRDRFGLSWQIVPKQLGEWMTGPDSEKSKRVMEALLGMKKLDIAALKAAYEGQSAHP